MNDGAAPAGNPPQEIELFREHPAMFKNQPLGFLLNSLLFIGGVIGGFMFPPWPFIATGIAAIIFLQWYLKCKSTTLIVTNEGTTLEKGLLSKSTNELWHTDVRNVQIQQTFFQRIMNVGTVNISSGGQADIEIIAGGIPDPHQVHKLIEDERRKQT